MNPETRFGRTSALRLLACALAFTALSLAAGPSTGSVRVTPELPRASLFRDLYDRLPAAWKSRQTVVVSEVSDSEMEDLLGPDEHRDSNDGSVVDGYYQPGRGIDDVPTITLRRSIHDSAVDLVFLHEYAHFIWDSRLSVRSRAEYRRIWARREKAGSLVTDYAADFAEEGFAEAVSHYLRRPAMLRRRDDELYKFLKLLLERLQRPDPIDLH